MSELLSHVDLKQYDLFHMRYGKGAIIVAVSNQSSADDRVNSDKYVAQVYASVERNISTTSIPLDPVKSITENNSFIKVSIEVKRIYDGKPSYHPINALIDRVVPVNQVTLEIVNTNNSA